MITYICMVNKETLEVTNIHEHEDWINNWHNKRHSKPWINYVAICPASLRDGYFYNVWVPEPQNSSEGRWKALFSSEIPDSIRTIGLILGAIPIKDA